MSIITTKNEIYSRIEKYGIIPTVKLHDENAAAPLAEALASAGLDIAEIDLEIGQAARSIRKIAGNFPDMLIIAGGAATEDQVKSAVDSGAKIIAARGPVKNAALYCVKNNIPIIIECGTPEEIKKAADAGVKIILWPFAKNKTPAPKYPGVKYVLRGGVITGGELPELLLCDDVIACEVSHICEESFISAREFGRIKNLASGLIYKMLGFDFSHVVINCENGEQAEQYAGKIESIFGLAKTDGENSVSNAGILEFMKAKSYGRNGQIAFSTDFMDRALFYLKKNGKEFIEESARFGENGEMLSIYLDSIIGGFAFKLVNKQNK